MKKIIMLLVVLLGFSASYALAADLKIAVVDIQKVIRESKAGEEARTSFTKEVENKRKIISAREETLKSLEDELRKASAQERAQKEEKLTKEAKDVKRLKDDLQEELRKRDAEIGQKLVMEIMDVVKKMAEENKYTLIIEKRQGVLYAQDAIDITGKVVEKYNSQKAKK